MDFSFLESLIGDPVVIKGCFIPGIFLSLLILILVYLNSHKKKAIRDFLFKNKIVVSVAVVFTSIILGGANLSLTMGTVGKLWNKPHPFIYYFEKTMEVKNIKQNYKIIDSAITNFNAKRIERHNMLKPYLYDTLYQKYHSACNVDELLFFYYFDDTVDLKKEIFYRYKESGKETFDRIKESIILKKSVYQKRLIEFEAKTNMYAALIIPCIFGLIILIKYFKSNRFTKYFIALIVTAILISNVWQYRHMVTETEPNCMYTAYYNLFLDELYNRKSSR